MLKFGMDMVPNRHWSNLNLPLLFCPTSKVEHLNPKKSFGVNNVIPIPLSIEKLHLHYIPQPHWEKRMPHQKVVMLGAFKVWLLLHALAPPQQMELVGYRNIMRCYYKS